MYFIIFLLCEPPSNRKHKRLQMTISEVLFTIQLLSLMDFFSLPLACKWHEFGISLLFSSHSTLDGSFPCCPRDHPSFQCAKMGGVYQKTNRTGQLILVYSALIKYLLINVNERKMNKYWVFVAFDGKHAFFMEWNVIQKTLKLHILFPGLCSYFTMLYLASLKLNDLFFLSHL